MSDSHEPTGAVMVTGFMMQRYEERMNCTFLMKRLDLYGLLIKIPAPIFSLHPKNFIFVS